MTLYIITIALGFVALAWSADRFVFGAAGTAARLGLSPLIIGLTIVAFGTSAPEMLVSAMAAWQDNAELAIGNALGSNIANMGIILGITAVVLPIAVHSGLLRREVPALFATMLLCLVLMLDGWLGRLEGLLLLLGLVGLVGYLFWESRQSEAAEDPMSAEYAAEIPTDVPLSRSLLWFVVGLAVLLVSARLLVWAAVELALAFGVSELVIGLSIVALGTSLPELAASIAAVRRNEHDIALGNLIGSNMFNLLGVIGLAGLIAPVAVESIVLVRDFSVMVVITLAALIISRVLGPPGRVGRGGGAILILAYAGYQLWLFTAA